MVGRQTYPSQVSIELCTTLDEIHQCVDLERAIWNEPDEDLTPSTILVIANRIGGNVLLARDGSKPVGFALALPALRGDLRYLHSHVVGVIPEYQNRGLGRQLKLKQRDVALGSGIPLMEWTFDPLAIGNAYFNIARLGAIVRRFHPNLYGVTASPLHGGLPTDRLVAEWWLTSSRVKGALEDNVPARAADNVEIVVPAEMEDWKKSKPAQAAEIQENLKAEFQERFANGLAVTGFRIESRKGIYSLEKQGS